MTLADSAGVALAVTAVVAVIALLAKALTPGGTLAGAVVGACVSLGFGLPGLAVLGTFFVVGTVATRIGWEKKKARGTAEAGEGRRDWKRVLGKGGVAAAVALLFALQAPLGPWCEATFAGAVAAALADTLGTEIGTLSTSRVLRLPTFQLVPSGTPGGVSILGTLGVAVGAVSIAFVADVSGLLDWHGHESDPHFLALQQASLGIGVVAGGFVGSMLESVAVGCGLRAPGFTRNLLTTAVGAAIASRFYLVQ